MTPNVAVLRAALEARATETKKSAAEAYFKGAVPFLGVKGPELDALFAATRPALDTLAAPARYALAVALLEQEAAELRHLGILTLHREVKRLPAGWLEGLRPLVERRATNWGTADAFAGRVVRYRLPDGTVRDELLRWSTADSPWLRRIACVAFVNEARKGLYPDDIRQVVPAALGLDHRFAQLGAGWLLRERWLAAPEEVEAFLRAHGPAMHREAVRYAVEKMPPTLRGELLAATARR